MQSTAHVKWWWYEGIRVKEGEYEDESLVEGSGVDGEGLPKNLN